MNKLKNKKRFSTGVLAFLLTFIIGSAFAFADGVLTINGTVTLDPNLRVIWYAVDFVENPVNPSNDLNAEAEINYEYQNIELSVTFYQPGDSATLTFSAENVGGLVAQVRLDSDSPEWTGAGVDLSGQILFEGTWGELDYDGLEPGENTADYTLVLMWDPDADIGDLYGEEFPVEGTFVITWAYSLAD